MRKGFFFQAEDGIRDHCVTGVQTCALPIWRRSGPPAAELGISVNVSPRQLAQPDFAATVARALETTGANPRQLCLEITEAALITDIDAARREDRKSVV